MIKKECIKNSNPYFVCNNCNQNTEHEICKEFINEVCPDEVCTTFYDNYFILRCKGCKSVSFLYQTGNSDQDEIEQFSFSDEIEQFSNNENKLYLNTFVYPTVETNYFADIIGDLPPKISKIIFETSQAYNYKLYILTLIGVRSCIEAMCKDKGISDQEKWGLKNKLQVLEDKKFILKFQKDILLTITNFGDNSAHHLKVPETYNIHLIMRTLRNIFENIYTLPKLHDDFKKEGTIG